MYLSAWFVLIIAVFIIFIVVSAWLIFFSNRRNTDQSTQPIESIPDPVYQLVWTTNFSGPLEQQGKFDYVRWAVPVMGVEDERGFYTDQSKNVRIEPIPNVRGNNKRNNKSHRLVLQVTNDDVFIKDNEGERNYSYSTARIVSTATFTTGLFIIKATMPRTQQGIWPFIRLHPLENIANHIIGSVYGLFPACGEIDMFDPVRHVDRQSRKAELQWTGRLYYGGIGEDEEVICPPNGKETLFPPIDSDEPRCFGLEWTSEYIAWYLDPKVDLNGRLSGGKLLQKFPSSKWYTLTPNGKKLPPPAPFDVPFHIGIGIAVGDTGGRYCDSLSCQPPPEVIDQKLIIDSVEVYQDARKSDNLPL